MFSKLITRMFGVGIGVGMLVCAFSSPVSAATNLLVNPGAELNGTGWTTISNGGNGMSYNFDGVVHSGAQSFQTSFGLDSISQTVDLFANGYSTSSMVSAPSIRFGVWVSTRNDQAGQYYVKFSLLQQDGTTVVTSTNFGTPSSLLPLAAGTSWFEVNYTFSNYGAGVRYAYIEFGGRDQSSWAGNYGTHFDDASIVASPVTRTNSGGGSSMPWWGYVPPKGPFGVTLHGGGSATDATTVLLDVSASPDVDRMAFSRYADFHDSGIVPLAASLPWSVCGAPTCAAGTYDVYAKFYQAYGLASPIQHLVLTYAPVQSDVLEAVPATSPTSSSTISISGVTSSVVLFTRNLHSGNTGLDVKRLQEFLNTHGYVLAQTGVGSQGTETDVFGPALRRALMSFQRAHAETLLAPFGLKQGTGIFGTQTRKLVNEMLSDGT